MDISGGMSDRGGVHTSRAPRERRNVFETLMEAVKTHSLRQISHALYDVGGEYRRNMWLSLVIHVLIRSLVKAPIEWKDELLLRR